MTIDEAIKYLSNPLSWAIGKTLEQQIADNKEATQMAIEALEQAKTNCSEIPNNSDTISRQEAIDKFIDALEEIFSDIRERHVDDSVCGLCEYDGAYIGQSGDWCNECPGFDRDDCFKLSDKIRKEWTDEIIKALTSVQPEQRWVPCSERQPDVNGWYITTISGEICGQDRAFSGMSEFANGKWTSGDDVDETEMTIAWMPLPEAYQEGEQK